MADKQKLQQEINDLKTELRETRTEIDLHWQTSLERQKEIEVLQEKKHQEVLKKQEEGFFKQKMIGLTAFLGILLALIGAFVSVVKKLNEAKKEIKQLIKK